jgi:hypothetical protein
MIRILLTVLLFVCAAVYSKGADSTLNIDLNFDSSPEIVKMKFNPDELSFELKVGNASVSEKFSEVYDTDLMIIDMDRNDNLREIVVRGYGPSDQAECFFYQYIEGKLVKCGYLPSNSGITTDGSKTLIEYNWMGFYSINFEYKFDTKAKTLTFVPQEFYEVDIPAQVTEQFTLLKYRNDDSERSAALKPGTKITLVKTDISPVCDYGMDARFDIMCDWFLIKTADGREGWCRLNMFNEKVDGLIWAG